MVLQLGVEAVQRHVQQGRDEAVKGVHPPEHPHPRPVEQVQHPHGDLVEGLLVDLEQLVAGIALGDGAQTLAGVGAGVRAGAGQHVLDLAAHQRQVARGVLIGLGGEQADEADLADGLALGVVALDPDVIHVAAAVDARLQGGLGHDQGFGLLEVLGEVGGQDRRLAGAAQHRQLHVAQHAQAALGGVVRLFGGVGAVRRARIVVAARAQEDEAVGAQPLQELGVLLGPIGAERRVGGGQLGGDLAHQGVHGGPVAQGGVNVGQGQAQGVEQGFAAVFADTAQHHEDHRLLARLAALAALALGVAGDLDHRVEHGPHLDAGGGQFAHHAVDQERRVVLDDLEQLEFQVAGVCAQGVRQAQLGAAAVALVGEAPEPRQGHGQVARPDARKLFGANIVRNLIDEPGLRFRQCARAQIVGESLPQGRRREGRDIVVVHVLETFHPRVGGT